MSGIQLPPLPEPAIFDPDRLGIGFSVLQMQEYAREAVKMYIQEQEDLHRWESEGGMKKI